MIRLAKEDPSKRNARRSERAKQCLAEANKRLVFKMANKFYRAYSRGDKDDVINAGQVGLARALNDYDDQKGFKFSTYAIWWVRHYIQRLGYKTDRVANLPGSKIGIMRDIRKETLEIKKDGLKITPDIMHEILVRHGIDEAEYNKIRSFDAEPYSMEAPMFGDDTVQASDVMRYDSITSSVMSRPAPSPEDTADRNDVISALSKIMMTLPVIQRQLVSMNYIEDKPLGKNGEIRRTKASVRRKLDIDKQTADRELSAALKTLRDGLSKAGYAPSDL
jgi:RNA polymerase sigma factor (sigma-70 family)